MPKVACRRLPGDIHCALSGRIQARIVAHLSTRHRSSSTISATCGGAAIRLGPKQAFISAIKVDAQPNNIVPELGNAVMYRGAYATGNGKLRTQITANASARASGSPLLAGVRASVHAVARSRLRRGHCALWLRARTTSCCACTPTLRVRVPRRAARREHGAATAAV